MSANSKTKGTRTARRAVRVPLRALLGLLAIGALLAAFAVSASADLQICAPGTTAGKCVNPQGVAVDFETGDVFVADNGNDHVDKFEENGKAIGTPASWPIADPEWIAVDNDPTSPSQHSVYLSTSEFSVKKFKPDGELLATFGEQGDGTPEGCQLERANDPIAGGPNGDVYLADSYDKDGLGGSEVYASRIVKFDDAGSCIGTVPLFEEAKESLIRNLAVDSTGVIYVTVSATDNVIRQYDGSGALIKTFEALETKGLAVDEADHLFAEQRGKRATNNDSDHFFTEYDSAAGGGEILRRFAYAPGAIPGFFPGLAADSSPDGDLYASEPTGVKYFSFPPPGPVLFPEPCQVKGGKPGSDKATLQAEVNPEGKATTFKYEYMTQAQFEAEGDEFKNAQSTTEVPLEGTADFELHEAAQKATGLDPETAYRCRIVATNADSGPEGTVGQEGTFTTGPPFEFGSAWSSDVGAEEATLHIEGNPQGIPATAQVEYVTDAQYQLNGFAEAKSAPTPELDYGAGEAMVLRSTTLTDLLPGTLYHYRLRAKNVNFPAGIVCLEGKTSCPEFEHTFRTFGAGGLVLPDGRRWELVSPAAKNSADVVATPNTRGVIGANSVQIQAGATDGEAVTYTAWTSFGEAEAAPGTSQYLSKRTESGWQTGNISPFGLQSNVEFPPYLGFSADLRFGAVKVSEATLAPDCPQGFEGFYLYESDGDAFRCLTPEAPQTAEKFGYCFIYGGASEDGSRVFFKAQAPYAGASAESGVHLYEWHEGKLSVISVLPGQSEPAPAFPRTAFGARSGEPCQTGQTRLHNAISDDGSKAIWTYVPAARATVSAVSPGAQTLGISDAAGGAFTLSFKAQTTAPIAFDPKEGVEAGAIQTALESLSTIGAGNVEVTGANPFSVTFKGALAGTPDLLSANGSGLKDAASQLLMRINGAETIQLDAVQGGGPPSQNPGNGIFSAASEDASVVYFTDENRLVKGSKSEKDAPDLYRYELEKPLGERLTNLTKASEAADVQGVIGASDDGSVVYSVAQGVLTPEAEENEAGQHSEAGKNNLYVFDGAESKTRFIAQLSGEDNLNWHAQPKELTARVSPNGGHLAFVSVEAQELAGYDNTLAASSGKFAAGTKCRISGVSVLFGGKACPQAFIYDKQASSLTCASCNPAGSRPQGPTILPGWTSMAEGPRYLSNDGDRLFFEIYDRLLPADENDHRDVYEFEFVGTGSCTSEDPAFDPVSGGCHFLISDGKSSDESFLIDASADGRDVFFSTRSALTGWDDNLNYDVYDAREGGGFPEPPIEPPPCEGEGCKPSVAPAPGSSTPSTPRFQGSGNVTGTPRPRCPKGKRMARKAGKPRCVKPRKGQKHPKSQGNGKRRQGR